FTFWISSFIFPCFADTFYGTLHGNEVVNVKSPYNGLISLHEKNIRHVYSNKMIYSIKNLDYISKKEILKLKIKNTEDKQRRLKKDYSDYIISFKDGFLSKNELNSKKELIDETQIVLQELTTELYNINTLLDIGAPVIKGRFIIRDLAVSDQQTVSAGDYLMQLEFLDNYYVDVKYDPAILSGKLQDKKVTFHSLVDRNISGSAHVYKINSSSAAGDVYGLMTATLVLNTSADLSSLLDTVFEIAIND
ncbi:hypothetical protein SNN70_004252, partial [Cronobacter malonaticus]|nr:hypothetical protein [Cronobacter malonaticus]